MTRGHVKATKLLKFVRSRNEKIPIFLMAERGEASSIPIDVMQMVDEFIWTHGGHRGLRRRAGGWRRSAAISR